MINQILLTLKIIDYQLEPSIDHALRMQTREAKRILAIPVCTMTGRILNSTVYKW